jgi:hypothetical protein
LQSDSEVPPGAGDSDHGHEEEFGLRTCFGAGQELHRKLFTPPLKPVLLHCEQDSANESGGCHPLSQTQVEMFVVLSIIIF